LCLAVAPPPGADRCHRPERLINALIVGNYLTTLGRAPADDLAMLADLRMPIGALDAAL
jgi:hypothetical protein